MTPHSEADERSTNHAGPVVRKAPIRPVIPLNFANGRKKKDTNVAVPAAFPGHTPYSAQITEQEARSNETAESVTSTSTHTGEFGYNTAQTSAVPVVNGGTAGSASDVTEPSPSRPQHNDSTPLSPPPSDTSTEPSLKDRKSNGNTKVDQENQVEMHTVATQITPHTVSSLIAPDPFDQRRSRMPPPGIPIPQQQRESISEGTFGGTQENMLEYGDYSNGIISPPAEVMVNAPSFVPGHSHHVSVSGATPPYPPTLQSGAGLNGFTLPLATRNLPNFQYPGKPPHPIDSVYNNSTAGLGGISGSRTMSQSSSGPLETSFSATPEDQIQRTFESTAMQGPDAAAGFGRASGHFQVAPGSDWTIDSAVMVRDYLVHQFGNPDFADYVLEVRRGKEMLLSIPVHGLLIGRSLTLHSMMARYSRPSQHGMPKVISVQLRDRNFVKLAFIETLQFLYGAPLATGFLNVVQQVRPFSLPDRTEDSARFAQQVLLHALSMASSGEVLHVEPVVLYGLDISKHLIRWDTLETALAFALEGGLPAGWSTGDLSEHHSRNGHPPQTQEVRGHVLHYVAEYLAINFPHHYEFVTSASQLDSCPRLPVVLDSKQSISNPRLSRIQFGQLPPEQTDFIATTLSTILLSLPFEVLKALFEHPAFINRVKGAGSTLRVVVSERESRRVRVSESKRVAPKDGLLYETTRVQEYVEDTQQTPLGITIGRRRIGD